MGEAPTECQEATDRFYWQHGPCCAGCDWWRRINAVAGECVRSPPVGQDERVAMMGMQGCSLAVGAGHVITPRDHHCGEFRDAFDWSTLAPAYLRRIGMPGAPRRE